MSISITELIAIGSFLLCLAALGGFAAWVALTLRQKH